MHIMRHLEEGTETFAIVEHIIDTAAALTAAVGKEVRDVPDSLWTGSLLHTLFGLEANDSENLSRQLTLLLRCEATRDRTWHARRIFHGSPSPKSSGLRPSS